MQDIIVIADTGGCLIELTHRSSDPGSWIVRRWRKFLWLKKRISTDWFLDKQEALAFAARMKRELDRQQASRH